LVKIKRPTGTRATKKAIEQGIRVSKTKTRNTANAKIPLNRRPKPFPIAAFGASAGGIKAFIEVLQNLEPTLGMAYVLIMHLSPNHKSGLREIMQSKTKMRVQTVKNGMEVEANW
jgi:two-component system, chemotaxis family, CheB/CheR fusion protein